MTFFQDQTLVWFVEKLKAIRNIIGFSNLFILQLSSWSYDLIFSDLDPGLNLFCFEFPDF